MRQTGSVVLADGDQRGRALVAKVLRLGGYETIEVETGADALAAARPEGVRLVALEVALPDMTGYEVCQNLRSEHGKELAILFVSGIHTEPLDRVAGLLFGADDFIVKPFHPDEFLARVSRFVSRSFMPTAGDPVGSSDDTPHLTDRERGVLLLLAEGRGQKEIAQQLSISSKTVGTHIQHLHAKLGVHSRAELVAHAYREGLVSPPREHRAAGNGGAGGGLERVPASSLGQIGESARARPSLVQTK